jgi:signal transduction histidine kinase/CHASE3 domain sensor protein/ActR/RegA family two-component response regulator
MKAVVHLRSPSRAAIVGFGISLAMLALVVGMSFRQLGRLREASRDVERSGEIAAHVELLRSYLRDAESAERGFVITGEDTYLEPYNVATSMIDHEIGTLRRLAADFPRQETRLDHLRRLIGNEVAQFAATIEIRRSEGFEAARRALRDPRGARLLGATGGALQRMADAQERLLRSRGQARLEASRSTMWSVAFTSAFAFMLLAAAIVVLGVIERRRARVLQELHDSRERLRVAAVEREDLLRRERVARAEAEAAAQANAESLALVEHAERERAAAASRRQAAHDIGAVAASHLDLDDLLQAVMERVREALAVDAVTVLLIDEEGGPLRVRAALGLDEEFRERLVVPRDEGIAGRIAISRAPLVVDDLARVESASRVLRERVASLMGVPLLVAGRPIGVMHVATTRTRRFTDEDLHLLELVGARIASAIEHARLFEAERQARTEAEAANRAKDEFLGTLSHELRSPLSAIRTWVHLLRRGHLDQAKSERALATIEESAKLQAQLIEDLLDVSRIVSGKLRMEARPVDLASVVESAIDTVRLAADAKDIALESRLAPIAGVVAGDPGRLQQVVWNLLSNAIKFTPRGGRVEVECAGAGTEVVITVADTGQGIAPEFLPHLFERFRQADSSSTRRHGGLGLGLAIVRHILELHGGRVEAESAGLGGGARFTVRLPLQPARPAPVAAGGPAARIPLELRNVSVLVVDDEQRMAEAVAAVLEETGARVTTALSVRDGLAAFSRVRPSVLVCDIAMPGEDGYALIRRVRALEDGTGHTPALALTAYAGDEDRHRALGAGYDRHLPKPVEPPELIAAVVELAARRATVARPVA